MPRNPTLTFQKSRTGIGGRWKKMYQGKVYYLGPARCKSDLDSYRMAIAKWESIKTQIDSQAAVIHRPHDDSYDEAIREWELALSWSIENSEPMDAELARQRIAELKERRSQQVQSPVRQSDRLLSRLSFDSDVLEKISAATLQKARNIDVEELEGSLRKLGPIKLSPESPSIFSSVSIFDESRIRWEDRIHYQEKALQGDSSRSIDTWIVAYLERYRVRMEAGDVTVGVVVGEKARLDFFQEWAGAKLSVDEINGPLLTRFHTYLLEKISRKECSPSYAKDRLSSFKSFVRWLWGQDVLPSLPKNINSHDLRISCRPAAPKTVSLGDIRAILLASTGVTRLYVLLALNCGMTQKDISDLQQADVDWKRGTITRKRSKTHKHEGVPTVTYQLWPETLQLLLQCRSTSDRVLVNRNGSPLVEEKLVEGKFRKNDNIKNAYERILKKVSLRSPFKLMRKTSATLIHGHERFRGLDSLFLGHAPASIAERHYSATSRDALNGAIEYLRESYGIGEVIDLATEESQTP
jgi:integrase